MKTYPGLENHLNWLLSHSLQAGVLVLLVLAVQWIFRRRLTNRWRFALWWIVLARLLLPFSPQSALSLFNFVQPTVQIEGPRASTPPAHSSVSTPSIPVPVSEIKPVPVEISPAPMAVPPVQSAPVQSVSAAAPLSGVAAPSKHTFDWNELLIPGLAAVWLGGMMILSGAVLAQLLRFRRKLANATAPADVRLQNLLEECRCEFQIRRQVLLLETDAVQSPALFGLFKLRLLVPRGFGGQFNHGELRYVFLHELAHVKRGDLWLNWLVTALQIVHWFNPLLWFGFARLRADRELACDELALLRAGDHAGTAYGETIVKLLENLNRPAAIPGLVGILEDKQQMRRRISMIANFRRPGKWSALAILLIAGVAAAALTDAQTSSGSRGNEAQVEKTKVSSQQSEISQSLLTSTATKPDLTGTVSAKSGGPLPVPATVFIATAAPKSGTSTFCPSCYADCVKHSKTDAQGNFKIESLDPQLTFQVLAVAKGFQPKSVSKVDPAKGPVKIELQPLADADAAPDRSLRGRVVDAQGKPVEGAVVEMVGIESKDGGGSYGALKGIDPLAVTDENGEFLITSQKPFDTMVVKVSARMFADKSFRKLPSGQMNKLVMTEGASLTGRVLANGKPLAGVVVGISGVERQAGVYVGHFEVGTDADGKFAFINIPPGVDYWLYTCMDSMKPYGMTPMRPIRAGKDGETTDAGDLVVQPAHRLAGRVALADGEPLPSKVRLLISRDEAWDSMQIILDKDGNFDTAGIPDELVDLSARVKGYHVAARNLSVDQMNPFRLIGRVDRDITNLVFLLEKGPDPQPDYSHVDPEYEQNRNRTLRGAEGVEDHANEWKISGRVVDAATREPIASFRVTPGQIDQLERVAWSTLRTTEGSNGVYQAFLSKRTAQPYLKVEADGYLPSGREILPRNATNLDFALQKGSGPAGTVVTADGQPVTNATVIVLTGDINEAGVNAAGELTAFGNRAALYKTDASGHFACKPVFGMKGLAIGCSNGLVTVRLESLATNATVILPPFGKISGTLKRASGPGTNEMLDVALAGENILPLNMWLPATTDNQGRFKFDRVPAGHLRITYREPISDNGWSSQPLREVDLPAGQTLEVNITAPDRSKASRTSFSTPPPLVPVPGEQVKGVVLRPDGQPAANAEVALQLTQGPFNLSLGRGVFVSSGLRDKGLIVNAGADGSFDLPLYQKAVAVVAVSDEGFAQISLEEFKASPRIQLEKFGRIEGTLRVGRHLGTNETVNVSPEMPRRVRPAVRQPGDTNAMPVMLQPLMYDWHAFSKRTDENGKFVIESVPPGSRSLWRRIPQGAGSWTQSQLGVVEVKPGETVVTNLGGTGRTVTGKLQFNDDLKVDFKQGMGVITTPTSQIFEKLWQFKTASERQAYLEQPEVQEAMANNRRFTVSLAADGSFKGEDILPGTYEFDFTPFSPQGGNSREWVRLLSGKTFTVPPTKDQDDDSTVEIGTVELKKHVITMPAQE
jgi:beta-lactamase regulating signal transducer with metallopeptidase domain/uncharacterized GH25 family protein